MGRLHTLGRAAGRFALWRHGRGRRAGPNGTAHGQERSKPLSLWRASAVPGDSVVPGAVSCRGRGSALPIRVGVVRHIARPDPSMPGLRPDDPVQRGTRRAVIRQM